MTLRSILKVTEKYVIDNSPTLLAAIAATGAITTAVLTGKATFKAAEVIREAQAKQDVQELGHTLETKEKIKVVWKEYIPPAIALTGTVTCIVLSNSISSSRLAAMAAAYKISEKQFTEYKDKIVEKFGTNKEQEVKDELAHDRLVHNPRGANEVYPTDGEVLCYDTWTARYFKCDMQTLRAAQNVINRRMISDMYASLADFYMEIGLSAPKMAGEIGWTIDHALDLNISTQLADGGNVPCLVIDFNVIPSPIRDFHRYNAG